MNITFSIIIPIFKPNAYEFFECLNSVMDQDLDPKKWEIILVHDLDGRDNFKLVQLLIQSKKNIKRIKAEEHLGISQATNLGASLADGEYLVFLDQDDTLKKDALSKLDCYLQRNLCDFVYSDYELIDRSGFIVEVIKTPSPSKVRSFSLMYAAHLKVISNKCWTDMNGYNKEFDGAQDFEFFSRLMSLDKNVGHIPDVLYQWRESQDSSQRNSLAKPEIPNRTLEVLRQRIEREGISGKAKLLLNFPTLVGIEFREEVSEKMSIVIPTRFAKRPSGEVSLSLLLGSIDKNLIANENIEIIVVTDDSELSMIEKSLMAEIYPIRWVTNSNPAFNYSKAVNLGIEKASNENLLIVNDDVQMLNTKWFYQATGYLKMDKVGVVGAKLLYPDGSIQHAGIRITRDGHCFHPLVRSRNRIGHLGEGLVDHESDAVTGAFLVTKKSIWKRVSGFNEAFPGNYNDVVYCLDVRKLGFDIIQANSIEATHFESLSRQPERTVEEIDEFKRYIASNPVKGEFSLTPENDQTLTRRVNPDHTLLDSKRILLRVIKSVKHRGLLGALQNLLEGNKR